ncbi:MAG: glycosyltransferase family 4 protein [Candidatus Moranbacteria bacterium]|nr:glycosyltransferase family 4 protein [Candidatus Moranbacteria bacterium]
MKILLISHSYPPVIGGIERQNYELFRELSKIADTKIIANTRGKFFLPIFLPYAFLKAFFVMTRYDACLLGSGVLSPLGAALKFFHTKKSFFSVIHGLDITFAQKKGLLAKIYAGVNINALKRLNKIFAVGNATIEEALNAGINEQQCKFIPNGVSEDDLREKHNRQELENLFGKNLKGKKVILRLARFVPHKGTSWFIENVMPKLPGNVVMIAAGNRVSKNTAGDQDDFINSEKAVMENKLEDRVRLLPCLPWTDVKILFNTVDLVVSPNIKVAGSMEGFGINAIEAGMCGRVVVASDLEGLKDAVKNGKNGFLIEPENAKDWSKKINEIFDKGDDFLKSFGRKSYDYVKENYSWDKIADTYYEEMRKASGK